MSTIPKSVKWGVPAVVGTALAAGLAVIPVVAGASPSLPSRTPAQLLESVQHSGSTPFSGRIVQTSRLGLPQVPGLSSLVPQAASSAAAGTSGSATVGSLVELLTGSHNAQVWYAGPTKARVSLTAGSTETDAVRDGRDAWFWTSSSTTAQHATLPADTDDALSSAAASVTPSAVADQALAAISPTTDVTVDGTAKVAGRSAYELVLKPKQSGSLVRQVRLAVDSDTSVPLRVQVFSTQATEAAFEVSFSSVSFDKPDDSVFAFQAPSGTKVVETGPAEVGDGSKADEGRKALAGVGREAAPGDRSGFDVLGTGWTSVLQVKAGDGSAKEAKDAVAKLPVGTEVSGSYGSGKLIETALVDVLVLEDGRVLAGAVTPQVLEQAAAG
ncbi:outer membrane lipoprotein-sorting protein [Motilibacter rhizosphaerae]|uniref:Outer membrane lipoprotein-sorting protein n=1 Tax=Motilibacter rhizosphaerae TaxID=598652 RepID=A0A4Q7NWY6_9ACTN|nr:hypothetical protein [Motilibacter rhizosphaerae]RZS91755.1 outer membrane lipoprotein-sorting protein [Motilibacter rhizosphaerae]